MLAGLKLWAEAAEQQQQQGPEASGGGAAGVALGDSSALSPTDLLPLVRLFQEYPLSKHAQNVLLGVSTWPGRNRQERRRSACQGRLRGGYLRAGRGHLVRTAVSRAQSTSHRSRRSSRGCLQGSVGMKAIASRPKQLQYGLAPQTATFAPPARSCPDTASPCFPPPRSTAMARAARALPPAPRWGCTPRCWRCWADQRWRSACARCCCSPARCTRRPCGDWGATSRWEEEQHVHRQCGSCGPRHAVPGPTYASRAANAHGCTRLLRSRLLAP